MAAATIDRVLYGVERLGHADIASADVGRLAELAGVSRDLRSWLASIDVAITRRTAELHAAGRAGAPEGLLADHGGQSAAEARAAKDRADVCDAMPLFDSALASGGVTPGHLDAIAKASRNLSDDAKAKLQEQQQKLLDAAAGQSVDKFGRLVTNLARDIAAQLDAAAEADRMTRLRKQSRVRHWIDGVTGLGKTLIELDPERHAALIATLDAHLASVKQRDGSANIPFEELKVNAFIELVSTGGDLAKKRVPEVVVIVDWNTLYRDVIRPDSVSETLSGEPVSLDTIRRLCCDAEIRLVTLAGAGERIDVDRQDRVANRAQRRALAALHRTCAHPDCDVMFEHCQIHHVTPWEHGGLTNLDNLIPLCSRHHHLVHEGRWRLALRPDRAVIWTRPDGVIHFEGYTTDRQPRDRVYVPEPDPPPARQP
ncbi:MAG: hypothetical protein RIR49_1075 [Actinomycetota bacterium]